MRENRQEIFTHGNLCIDSLHTLSSIKYSFYYIYVAVWLFVIPNKLMPSTYNLLVVVIIQLSGGRNCQFERNYSAADVLIDRI